jgi:F0F1-type ATP synthase delta subunit
LSIDYKLNKALLGGLLVRTEIITIDVSVRHQIEQFASEAKKFFSVDFV